ncbi:MAG: histone deacetylase family protein [Actinomycetota bacterium]
MLVVRSDAHRVHHGLELDGGRLVPSWESPDRADHVDRAIDATTQHRIARPAPLPAGLLDEVHDPEYVSFLAHAWDRWAAAGRDTEAAMGFGWPARRSRAVRPEHLDGQFGYHSFAADCSITAGTWDAVYDSAAIASTAATAVADGEAVAFARCRPPGHHAMRDQFGGYCFLNNAAIAAQTLRRAGHAHVAVLDVDYHHGNGTQDIFYERADVAVCNIHADPRHAFPFFLGHADEHGAGAGEQRNRNLPLPLGTDAPAWFDAFAQGADWLLDHAPTALVVSLGLDTFEDDPISHFRLRTSDFGELGARLAAIGLPTVLVLEGGYATEALGDNVVAVLNGFARTLDG